MRWNTYAAGTKLPAQQTGHEQIDRLRRAGITTGVFWMVIPYTTPELTRAALRHAEVCSDLDVQISLVDIQVVPFPYPLDQPPINREFSEQRLRRLLEEKRLPGQVTVLYTRDRLEAFKRVLEPGSLVILGTKKRRWPNRERKLARSLLKAGHQVMLLPM